MRAVFRADASSQIGSGHVVRCLTLADALQKRGMDCQFIARDLPGNLNSLIRERGFQDNLLRPRAVQSGCDWQEDAKATVAALDGACPEWLIVDHYALDARWESVLKEHCQRILVVDDLADRQHDCDLLLDQNLVAGLDARYDGKVPDRCGIMLGPKYALLQPQYAELHNTTPRKAGQVKRVFVYFGGADSANVTGRTVSAFLSLRTDDVFLDVVVSPDGPHTDAIRRQVETEDNVQLHLGLPSLASLMAKADIAIGAGGATSWERCCLGLPSLIVTLAENQVPIAKELDSRGLAKWLGDQNVVGESELACALREMLSGGVDQTCSEDCRQLVDGRGVERVRGVMVLGADTPLVVRLARLDDESLILEWANDPLVRRHAFVPGAIDPDTHRAWFRKRVNAPEQCRLYVVESDEGVPVGQVRFERSGESWEVHYGLDVKFRGRGVGGRLLETALDAFGSEHECRSAKIFGRVKRENKPSRQVFRKLGFSEERQDGELIFRHGGR